MNSNWTLRPMNYTGRTLNKESTKSEIISSDLETSGSQSVCEFHDGELHYEKENSVVSNT